MRYIALIQTDNAPGYGVSFPDFPGCIAQDNTVDAAVDAAREALAFHVEGMRADGEAIPAPRTSDEIFKDPEWAEECAVGHIVHIPLILDRGSPRRVNISVDVGLLEAIDHQAKSLKMTRSAFLSNAARKEIERA